MAEVLGFAALAAYMIARMMEQLLWRESHPLTRVFALLTIVLVMLAAVVGARAYNVVQMLRTAFPLPW